MTFDPFHHRLGAKKGKRIKVYRGRPQRAQTHHKPDPTRPDPSRPLIRFSYERLRVPTKGAERTEGPVKRKIEGVAAVNAAGGSFQGKGSSDEL